MKPSVPCAILLLIGAACSTSSTMQVPVAPVVVADGGDAAPPRICHAAGTWQRGHRAFSERTSSWGLDGVMGNTFGVADVNGDGYADLVVTDTATYARGLARLFINTPKPGGGRMFVDQTEHSGLFATRDGGAGRATGIVTFGDVDNDGDVDAFTSPFVSLGSGQQDLGDGAEILLNDGHGVFTLAAHPVETVAQPLMSGTFFFDQNLDGKLDLFAGYWWIQPPFTRPFGQQPQLFRGDATGAFANVTDAVGMTLGYSNQSVIDGTNARPLFGATLCDVNDDGRPDIVGAAYGRYYNELFLADGDRFSEVARARGVASDERTDFSDDQSYRCHCRDTPGACPSSVRAPAAGYPCPGRGWAQSSEQPFNLGGNTFSYACADLDNDGDLDLYESNIRHPDVGSSSDPSELLINDGTGHFTRPGRDAMGLTPPIDLETTDEGGQNDGVMDFDNDGWQDLYLGGSPYPGNRGWLFHQTAPLRFEWIGDQTGFFHACPHGMALADFDHDGDEDVIVGTYGCNGAGGDWSPASNQPVRVYENVATETASDRENNWLSIRLVGKGTGGANSSGLGARVRVTAGGVTQTRLVHNSWGRGAMAREPVAFFGLGAACDVTSVEVRWPNGTLSIQTFTGVLANYRVELREGDPAPHYLP